MNAFKPTVGGGHAIEKIELEPSGGGVFDVFLDGERVFSKKSVHRFPNPGEVEEIVRQRLG